MLLTAKCFWPGATVADVELAVARADRCRAALYFPGDETVLCLFEADSRRAVKESSERAGLPCERVIDSVWIDGSGR